MMFATIAALVVGARVLLALWSATREREIRWKLYAVRDELRYLAIKDAGVASLPAFPWTDFILTENARSLETSTVWEILPYFLKSQQAKKEEEVDEFAWPPEGWSEPRLEDIRTRSHRLMFEWLKHQHFLMFTFFRLLPQRKKPSPEEIGERALMYKVDVSDGPDSLVVGALTPSWH